MPADLIASRLRSASSLSVSKASVSLRIHGVGSDAKGDPHAPSNVELADGIDSIKPSHLDANRDYYW